MPRTDLLVLLKLIRPILNIIKPFIPLVADLNAIRTTEYKDLNKGE
jgi:hypothetical protein